MVPKRVARVSMELKRVLSDIILRELKDPRLGFTTITRVKLTSDLKSAKIFISVLGESDQQRTLNSLRHARGYIQHLLGEKMTLRFMPTLAFELDKSTTEDIGISLINDEDKKGGVI